MDQYAEWQKSRHAKAFTSKEFASQSDHYADSDCLFCHVPGDVLDPKQQTRQYNRQEGVTCISCHLHDQAMQGPHVTDGLFSPHAVDQNNKVNSRLDSPVLCGVCHVETFEQWQEQQQGQDLFPTCHGCHGAPVTRRHTKGTNMFSSLLVAFEDEHEVRSHHLMLPGHLENVMAPQIRLLSDTDDGVTLEILNTLPHDLPTGSFGEKQMRIQLQRLRNGDELDRISRDIPEVLSPGQRLVMTLRLRHAELSRQIQVSLLRLHGTTHTTTLIQRITYPQETNDQP